MSRIRAKARQPFATFPWKWNVTGWCFVLESEHVLCSLIFNKNLCLSCCLFQFSFETELAEYHDGYTIRDIEYDYRYFICYWHMAPPRDILFSRRSRERASDRSEHENWIIVRRVKTYNMRSSRSPIPNRIADVLFTHICSRLHWKTYNSGLPLQQLFIETSINAYIALWVTERTT